MKDQIRRWRALWNPAMYHGWGRQRSYFEGWYFKLVDPAEQFAFAVIPGISFNEQDPHAFIQLLDGKRCQAHYLRFSLEDFRPDERRFSLQLGNNRFETERIRLDLPQLKGELQLLNPIPWPKSLGAPGIMGWYSFVPFMECYHGIVSLHHHLAGKLEVEGKTVDFSGGLGYTEKDWGVSFPSSWIWMQSNHFENSSGPMSLFASVARIPWLGSYFVGYIAGFLFQGRLHRFATYTGARMKAGLEGQQVQLGFRDRRYRLEILATPGPGGELLSPISGAMTGKVNESMTGQLQVSFFEKDRLLFQGSGRNAGLEVAGPAREQLLSAEWRR